MTLAIRTRHTAPPIPAIWFTATAACAEAAKYVETAGFQLQHRSLKSEAVYYSFPGRRGVLRIATHGKGGKNEWAKDGPTLVSITFPVNLTGRPTYPPLYIENAAANAVGLFLIRAEAR